MDRIIAMMEAHGYAARVKKDDKANPTPTH